MPMSDKYKTVTRAIVAGLALPLGMVACSQKQGDAPAPTPAEHQQTLKPETGIQDIMAYMVDPAADFWERVERAEWLYQCLQRLQQTPSVRPRDYAAFAELVLEGQPVERVAQRYGLTANRLYGIKHELLQRLRRFWFELESELEEAP